jgi:hypothetical protein
MSSRHPPKWWNVAFSWQAIPATSYSIRPAARERLSLWQSSGDAYFLGANDPYSALKTTLKAEIDPDAWATLNSDTSRPFDKPKNGRIAVKVINHLRDEVMKVFKV